LPRFYRPCRGGIVAGMELIVLPTDGVVSCNGCGACCDQQGTSPFMPDEYDALPDELKWDRGTSEHDDRYDRGLPCLWYDAGTRSCLHYDVRPDVCREFERGGEDCLRMRVERGVR